jgi:hypothetical protein
MSHECDGATATEPADEKQNAELFTLTYGALVVQLIKVSRPLLTSSPSHISTLVILQHIQSCRLSIVSSDQSQGTDPHLGLRGLWRGQQATRQDVSGALNCHHISPKPPCSSLRLCEVWLDETDVDAGATTSERGLLRISWRERGWDGVRHLQRQRR